MCVGRNVPRLVGAGAKAISGDDGQVVGSAREAEGPSQAQGLGCLGLARAGQHVQVEVVGHLGARAGPTAAFGELEPGRLSGVGEAACGDLNTVIVLAGQHQGRAREHSLLHGPQPGT